MVLITASCTVAWTPFIVLQALCLSDLIPWIYLSLPLYNCKVFTEWSSGFPYFLQFQSEFGNKEFMIWASVSSLPILFLWLYRANIITMQKSMYKNHLCSNFYLVHKGTWENWIPWISVSLEIGLNISSSDVLSSVFFSIFSNTPWLCLVPRAFPENRHNFVYFFLPLEPLAWL